MSKPFLRAMKLDELRSSRPDPVPPEALEVASSILEDVRSRGEPAAREHAERLGDLEPGAPMFLGRDEIAREADMLDDAARGVLERTIARVRAFAEAQRASIHPLDVSVPGGRAGHTIAPVERAGCYAPGGRFPLPSSAIMTAVTARAAGVRTVWVASPRPTRQTLAAAALAGADGVLAIGGAQAIAALAYGLGPVKPCDVIVGPGNRYVTAAKQLVVGRCAIDMLAGPSELLIIADDTADPELVAADLLAQAEHDTDARPILVTLDPALPAKVETALGAQLASLPTAETARAALANGFVVLAGSERDAIVAADLVAPEHLQVMTRDARALAARLDHYGAVFIGSRSAEVLGDYGVGPNHVLPTGGTARHAAGLSVFTFLRVRTWLAMDPESAGGQRSRSMIGDAVALGEMEGLIGHARAAAFRLDR